MHSTVKTYNTIQTVIALSTHIQHFNQTNTYTSYVKKIQVIL